VSDSWLEALDKPRGGGKQGTRSSWDAEHMIAI